MKSRCSGIEYHYLPDGALSIQGIGVYRHDRPMPEKVSRWRKLIYDKAIKYNIPPALIVAVMWQESGGDPKAGSYADAFGLMQVILSTAKSMAGRYVSKEELFDPELNVDLGSKLLSQLYKQYSGNIPYILGSYNAGGVKCGTGKKYPSKEPCAPNRYGLVQNCGYIDSVIKNYNRAIELGWDGKTVTSIPIAIKVIGGIAIVVMLVGGSFVLSKYVIDQGYLE